MINSKLNCLNNLGAGYDVRGLYADGESTLLQLFNFPADDYYEVNVADLIFQAPRQAEFHHVGDQGLSVTTAKSIDKYQTELTTSAGIGGMYEAFTASAKLNFSVSESSQTDHAFTSVVGGVCLFKMMLLPPSEMKQYLTEDVKNDLDGRMDALTVLNTYGAYYLSSALVGGRINYNINTNLESFNSKADLSVSAKASFDVAFTAEATSSQKTESQTLNTSSEINWYSVGGTTTISGGKPDNDSSVSVYNEWAETVRTLDGAAIMDFTKDSLVPIWDLVDDPKRKQELIDAQAKYFAKTPAKLPKVAAQITTNLTRIGDFNGVHAKHKFVAFQPTVTEGQYWFGHIAVPGSNHQVCSEPTLVIEPGADTEVIAEAVGFTNVWSCKHHSVWVAVPPPGYVALGCLVNCQHDGQVYPGEPGFPFENFRCLKKEYAVEAGFYNDRLWDDDKSGCKGDVSLWPISVNPEDTLKNGVNANLFYAWNHKGQPTQPVYCANSEFLLFPDSESGNSKV